MPPSVRAGLRHLVLAIAVAASLGAGGCNGGGGEDEARALLERAAEKRIGSAQIDLRLRTDIAGLTLLGGPLVVRAQGPARANGAGAPPTLDWKVDFRDGGQSFLARLAATPRAFFVEFQGRDYEASLRPPRGAGPARRRALSPRDLGLDLAGWLDEPEVEAGDPIDGEPTRRITGEVDERAVAEDLSAASDALRVLAIAAGVGESALPGLSAFEPGRVEDAVQEAEAEVRVDDKGFLRALSAQVRLEPPPDGGMGGIDGGRIAVELVLERLGVEFEVTPPEDAESLSTLLRAFGALLGIEGLGEQRE
jgi:hypothetical protein